MFKTRILTDREPAENLLAGAETLYKAVSTTMGPRGNNVIFRKVGGKTGITHDGVTVAKVVKIDDPAQDIGADLLREAAMKLDGVTGDGTTTVTVIAYHLLNQAMKRVKKGANPMALRLVIDRLGAQVIEELKDYARTEVSEDDIIAVATVAAGDKIIGEAVGKAVYEAGDATPIVLGFSEATDTTTEVINGFKIGSGAISPYLLQNAGLSLEIQQAKIIVCDAQLRDKDDILPILQTIAKLPPEERKFLLVANDVSGDALSLLVINRLKGFAEIAVARTPAHIVNQTMFLEDVAMASGAQVMSRNTGYSLATASDEDFGYADRVLVDMEDTVIVNGRIDPKAYDKHILKLQATKKKSPKLKKLMEDRLATLEQKVISIKVGGQSETEAEERHYRYEDAVGAAKAALREGVVPGGGTTLWHLGKWLDDDILGFALQQPLVKILSNAGIKVPRKLDPGMGIDVMHPDRGVIDMEIYGILDPVQTEIECVKTAITIAGLLLTSGAMIVDEEIKSEANPAFPSFNQG